MVEKTYMRGALKKIAFGFTCVLLLTGRPQASDHCLSLLLDQVFTSHYSAEDVYKCSFCFYNSGELARKIRDIAGTQLALEKLSILIIKHKELSQITIDEAPFEQTIVGMKARNPHQAEKGGHYVIWRYHAVLEYQGKILDLDLNPETAKGVLPAKEYFETQFPAIKANFHKTDASLPENRIPRQREHNQWVDMEVIKVPASTYFSRFPAGRPTKVLEKELEFLKALPKISVYDFLDAVETAGETSSK